MELFKTEEIFNSLVDEISELIHEDIILTNEKGIIVASTEKNRVSQFHEGASQAIQERKKLVMTDELSSQLKGVRKGIVLPIIIEGVPIGVLGITGNPKQVEPYALIVQKMAELFIQGTIDQMTQEEVARNLEIFALDWLSDDVDVTKEALQERGDFFNINIQEYEQVFYLYMPGIETNLSYRDLSRLKTWWDGQERAIFLRWGQGRILIVDKKYKKEKLRRKLKDFIRIIKIEFNQKSFFGVGQPAHYLELVSSYRQAIRACKIAEIHKQVIFDEELRFETLQYELTEQTKDKFIGRTISPLLDDKTLMKTLTSWLENNMSIQKTSEKLYIHKNTLYYRLRKIENLTDLDVRKIGDITLFYIAMKFLEESYITTL